MCVRAKNCLHADWRNAECFDEREGGEGRGGKGRGWKATVVLSHTRDGDSSVVMTSRLKHFAEFAF